MATNGTQVLFDRTSTSSSEYIGTAASGVAATDAQWCIVKVDYDADSKVTAVKYAGGTKTAVNVWNDRTTLSYS